MSLDRWMVLIGGIALMYLTYWFFLAPAKRDKDEEHHH